MTTTQNEKDVTFIICSRKEKQFCPECSSIAVGQCGYLLKGAKAGQLCGRFVCAGCASVIGNRVYCGAHSRIVKNGLAKDPV